MEREREREGEPFTALFPTAVAGAGDLEGPI